MAVCDLCKPPVGSCLLFFLSSGDRSFAHPRGLCGLHEQSTAKDAKHWQRYAKEFIEQFEFAHRISRAEVISKCAIHLQRVF